MVYAFLLLAFGLISAYEIGSGLLELALLVFCTCGGDERAQDGIWHFRNKTSKSTGKANSLFLQLSLPPPLMKILLASDLTPELGNHRPIEPLART